MSSKELPCELSALQPAEAPAAARVVLANSLIMSSSLKQLIGESVLAPDGKSLVAANDFVAGRPLVAIYFSAPGMCYARPMSSRICQIHCVRVPLICAQILLMPCLMYVHTPCSLMHRCGPCRGFTPKLKAFYEMLEEEGSKLPIIFASSDKDEASFQEYFVEMPWHSFPFKSERIAELSKKYEVSGIPWLVVLNAATGELVMNEVDTDVPQGTPAMKKWLATASAQAA